MRILLPSLAMQPGGGFRALANLASILAGTEHSVELLVVGPITAAYAIDPRVKVTCLQHDYRSSVPRFLQAMRYVTAAARRADLVIINFFILAYPVFLAGLASHTQRFVWWIQTDDPELFGKILEAAPGIRLLKRLLAVGSYKVKAEYFCVSKYLAQRLKECYGLTCEVLYPTIDTGVFRPDPSQLVKSDLVTCMGWSESYKGLPTIRTALAQVRQSRPQIRLRVVTSDPTITFSENWIEVVKPQTDSELVHSIRESYVFVHCSTLEGFGLPPLEAMACGVPVVALQTGGMKDYLEHGKNSLCFLTPDSSQLAREVIVMLDDRELRTSIIAEGFKTVRRFSTTACRTEILDRLKVG